MQHLTPGTRSLDADRVQPHWTAKHNQIHLLPVSTNSCCFCQTQTWTILWSSKAWFISSLHAPEHMHVLKGRSGWCFSNWISRLMLTCRLFTASTLSLCGLYIGLFLFIQERLVILKFQDFGGLLLLLLFLIILGFFGLVFFFFLQQWPQFV